MVPPFNKHGLLPEGVHRASEEELESRFIDLSPRRKWLGEHLQNLLVLAKSTGKLERVFLWEAS